MSNQSPSSHQPRRNGGHGLLGFAFGLAAGAAAVFLSREENRQKTAKHVKDAQETLEKTADNFQQDPEKTVAEIKADVKKKVRKAAKTAGSHAKKAKKKAASGGSGAKRAKRTKRSSRSKSAGS